MRHMLMSPISTLRILKDIQKDASVDKYKNPHGLCFLFSMYNEYSLRECLKQAYISWAEWPLYSGNKHFPVPSDDIGLTAEDKFLGNSPYYNMWSKRTKYGKNRRALLDWLIEQLEKVVEDMV